MLAQSLTNLLEFSLPAQLEALFEGSLGYLTVGFLQLLVLGDEI